ncbi:hypothetical protein [Streptomyces canus]|uniref:hypothetical protein n=1 Tax=Streptomyces canus TaxID=58343 RepID=UPI0038705ACD|nr:hypothetical protein OH824_14285 [Streptomyces canus]
MGFNASPRAVRIDFSPDHQYHGAEARIRHMSLGEWEAVIESDEDSAVEEMAKRLVDWNFTDDNGDPIPATREGLRQVDTSLVTALKVAWIQSLTGVHAADPLPQSSPSGEPSLVASVPMEALSPSLAS